MLIKFETKSSRVKGLTFHPKRRWLLASLHNGVIQLWDYGEKTMIDKFDEHKGPVRGLDFHKHQPLFVSGGDDYKLKVWNYKSRRCLFTLDAHEDYIRTAFFHHEHPWILSASDDQSIRIWNWQSRSRIAVLTGHTHYVMCAQFHPSLELILSASIDQTLRIWDITGLKMKNTSSSLSKEEIGSGLPEILSRTVYSVESKEAHYSEINWCAFHPESKKALCVSAADDNNVKLWKLDYRSTIKEVDTLRGHYNNVNCAIFHPRKDLVLSVSEDRSIRIWDFEKRTSLKTHRRELDRFWTLAAHPKEDLFAAGHDSGLMLFKLERERPAFTVVKDTILFIKANHIYKYSMKTHEKGVLLHLKPKTELAHYYRKIHCYSYDENQINQILVSLRAPDSYTSVYDLYKHHANQHQAEASDPVRNPGLTAMFVGPNIYVVLAKNNHLHFVVNGAERKVKYTICAEEIFEAGPARIFVKPSSKNKESPPKIELWDLEKGCAVSSINVDAKRVVMSDDREYIAFIGNDRITICDGRMNILSTVHEQRKIKSAAWEESGVLVYSTPVHIKYALTDGDSTTIVSVSKTLYIIAVRDNRIFCIDRNGDIKQIPVDSREFKFKQAVIRNERSAILSSLRQLGSLTRAEISFLVKKGHPGLALKFVKDKHTRFPLALQAFDIDEALQTAIQINERKCWEQLANVAMQVGHIEAVERAYKELKKPYKLAMLYLVSDQRDKMIEARSLARDLGDTSTEFIISLLLKDFTECTQIIRRCGHPNLAYTCAVNHGLYDLAFEISQELTEKQMAHLPPLENARTNSSWMQSTIPTIGNSSFDNWPMLNDEQENFEDVLADKVEDEVELEDNGDWEDDEFKSSPDHQDGDQEEMVDAKEDGWVDDDEPLEDLLDDDEDEEEHFVKAPQEKIHFTAPNAGKSITSRWAQVSDLALHHTLAGSYQTAIGFLQTQVGVVNAEPLKDIFKDLALQSRVAYNVVSTFPTMYIYPTSREFKDDVPLPSGGYKIDELEKRLTECYGLFSSGKFADGIISFRNLLLSTLFLQIYQLDTKSTIEDREARAKEIISICREYILGLQIWLERKNIVGKEFEDNKRSCELAAYFARLNLPKHRSKVLEKAFEVFLVKPKEFQKTRAASSIARRLLDYISASDPKKAKMVAYAEKVKTSYDAQVDQKVQLEYDDLNPYSLCAATFRPIFSGNQLISCPLCDAKYKPEFAGEVCKVCLVSQIGKPCTGIRFEVGGLMN